jgi:hypothetical protein
MVNGILRTGDPHSLSKVLNETALMPGDLYFTSHHSQFDTINNSASSFTEGLSAVGMDGEMWFIDHEGRVVSSVAWGEH